MNTITRLLLGILALVLAGCSTIDSRIKEKSDVFARLDPVVQAKIKQGVIDIGFTSDMVYIALGQPDEISERTGQGGQTTSWKYNTYYERYVGTVRVGYRRFVYWDDYLKAYRIYYEPVYQNVYSVHKETYIRVVFNNDKVAVIEQTKQ